MLLQLIVLSQTCSTPYLCNTGDQIAGGQKVFTGLVQAYGNYSSAGDSVSFISINSILVGGVVSPVLDDGVLTLQGKRASTNPGPGVSITNKYYLSTGGYLGIYSGGEHPAQLLIEDFKGNLITGAAPNEDGSGATDVLHRGMIIVGNTASGAIAIQSAPKEYLTFEYRLAEQCAKNVDGTEPIPDGGYTITCYSDGGCCYDYAGKHGGITFSSSVPMKQGWLHSESNPGVYGSDDKFIVHATGAFGQANGLLRAQFPTCPSPLAMTNLGQFYPGVPPGVIAYAADEDIFYKCYLTGWKEDL